MNHLALNMKKNILILLFLTIISAKPTQAQHATDSISFSLFLIGNAGKFSAGDPQEQKLFETVLAYNANPKGLVFLGNNLYPSFSDLFSGQFDDKAVNPALERLKDFDGPLCFVPGWSDWSYGAANGKDMVRWEYKTINKTLKNKAVYMPDWGCPGPVEVPVNDSLTIILLDTQWWMHPFDTRFNKCDLEDKADVWTNLRDVLRRNRNKQVVVAGYHPVVSYGEYGGYFSPVMQTLGFPVALYRKKLGTRLDLAHPLYAEFASDLKTVLEEFPNVIYASSHEKNFQYFTENNVHYLIGGSLIGGSYVKKKETECSSEKAGISRIDFYRNGKVGLKFFPIGHPDTPDCATQMYDYEACADEMAARSPETSFADSIKAPASTRYAINPRQYKWVGENYRAVWGTPVTVPVFNIAKEKGGLEVVKRGGGQQTQSLRLEAANKHQYALRSVEKNVEGALPDDVKNTFAVRIVQDNISASNPYAALVAAQLAEAAGVMHTNPAIVYVPLDYRLGEYTEDLARKLFLFEERPAGNWSDQKSFGYSRNIVSTDEVLEKTEDSPQNQVDQTAVLRARILDTFLSDWDRHDDQWRWASFREQGKTIYRPIPRDRDQAFYVNQGRLPWLITRKWLVPKFQNFAPKTDNINGLTFNARYFDRTFLTEPGWDQWQAMLDSLTGRLTDETITGATRAFPREVRPFCADSTAKILIERKAFMPGMIRQHYLALAKNVTVTGTNENDRFTVQRLPGGQTDVTVWNESQTIRQYHRIFRNDETREIRLYGRDGKDRFTLEGIQDEGTKIRIIGGNDHDFIQNNSQVNSPGKHTLVYDRKGQTQVDANSDTRLRLSRYKQINHYDRMDFHYDVVTPGLLMGYNPDDGLFIGGGPIISKYRFRRHETHTILANFASLTGAFNARYLFESLSDVRGWDHHTGIDLKAPDYAMNFFGTGNASVRDKAFEEAYYRLRVNQFTVHYSLGKRWGATAFSRSGDGSGRESELQGGVFLKRSKVEEAENRFITSPANSGGQASDFESRVYSGFRLGYSTEDLNNRQNPKRGYRLQAEARQFWRVDGGSENFTDLSGDLRAYISFTENPRTVLAFRLGGEKLFGDYSFTEAAKLGGKTNLRGYLADRFYGDASVFQNTELRYKVKDFKSYLLNGELGILGFFDSGRVWLKNEEAGHWHKGYGAGFWLSPFGITIVSATYNWSTEDRMLQVSVNFKI